MITQVLMAYDGSESADKAFEWSLDLAKKYGAALHVVAIVRPPDFAEDVESEAFIEDSRRHCESLLERLKSRAANGAAVKYSVLFGHPAEQIVIQAERDGAQLIVIGHRGKGLFERLRVGSVSKQVLHDAHCAVLVVR
jgi:nucleotide-binding universal stress UspA family protein